MRLKDVLSEHVHEVPGGEELLLGYWNSLEIDDVRSSLELIQHCAVALLVGIDLTANDFSFFIVHLLTSSYAVRVLLPVIPAARHLSLIRQWWLLTLSICLTKQIPDCDVERIRQYDCKGRDWEYVVDQALHGKSSGDEHFVKGMINLDALLLRC